MEEERKKAVVENENPTKQDINQEEQETNQPKKTKKKSKIRMILVILFILIFAITSYIQVRGSYLEYLELGEKYLDVFYTNIIYRYALMAINFVILFFVIYMTNRGIKKGLKPFFDKEKKEMPKLLNKSISLVISIIISVFVSDRMMQNIMLVMANTSFGITDPIFGLDIAYYVFQKPLIEMIVYYIVGIVVGLTIYMTAYYILVFNRYFDGVDRNMLKDSLFMKKLTRNVLFIILGVAIITILGTQNLMFGKILTIDENIEINGAGMIESTIRLWGYIIFAFVIVIFAYRALKYFKQGNTAKVLKNLAVIPIYLVVLFVVMVAVDLIYVNANELDRERTYIAQNIENTKNAYGLDVEEEAVEYSGTVTEQDLNANTNIVNNIPIISEDAVLITLENTQTSTGYYTYRSANLAKYKIGDEEQIVYLSPREITSSDRTYSNKTYEYTHGYGEIITSATESSETGNIEYIQKNVSGNDEIVNVTEPRIYFSTDDSAIIATNTKNKQEYDYTDENGNDVTSSYDGKAGLQLGFLDRFVLAMYKGDINLAFSTQITSDSKILINRNIIERAKKALPYLMYDENPYTVIGDDGKIYWVLDAYTISSSYPYSQYTEIEHEGGTRDINYIRNSVKVIIDAYNGTMNFYITDRTDPIAMAYRNIYPSLFADLDEEIPKDIAEHFVYPEFLYDVQAELLKIYHNVRPDVLYRSDDLWDFVRYNNLNTTRSTGTYLEPYYIMVKTDDGEELGLMQIYTQNNRQNIISYLVGTTDGGTNKLKLCTFSADSNIVSPTQLDNQIAEDEAISSELKTLETTGTRITKQMIIVPIGNTLLYVEPIYQTMINESEIPLLKKVVVASGNKVAIGDTLQKALQNLLSNSAVDIEVENTEDIDGLIDSIIKANQNLKESTNNSDWSMMGSDIERLQTLIDSLETMREEENANTENTDDVNNTNTIDNTINENIENSEETNVTVNENEGI